MNTMTRRHRKQSGITLIGFLMVLTILGFIAYTAMTLGPIYVEYYAVVKAMKSVAGKADANTSLSDIQKSLQKQFDIGYVDTVTGTNAKLIHDKDGNKLNMNYEARRPFIYNVDFVVKFDYTVPFAGRTVGE